jgi:prephenate dehydratase
MIAIELIFSVSDAVGSLRDSLDFFNERGISLRHIQSRPSLCSKGSLFEFLVEFKVIDDIDLSEFENECIKRFGDDVKIITKSSIHYPSGNGNGKRNQ